MDSKNKQHFQVDIGRFVDSLSLNENNHYLPVYEAVVNSIQSIEKSDSKDTGIIGITIKREAGLNTTNPDNTNACLPITGFVIEDNGQGFTPENMDSFRELYSGLKKEMGCKGIGRFYWLKVFNNATITSVYQREDKKYKRSFKFTKNGVIDETNEMVSFGEEVRTTVRLNGFIEKIRNNKKSYKKTETIAKKILQHCLTYYIYDNCPKIEVCEEIDGKKSHYINLSDLYSEIVETKKDAISTRTISVSNKKFQITHIKLYNSNIEMSNIVFCAHKWQVKSEKIERIFGVTEFLDEDGTKFNYAAYVSGDFLDEKVNDSRTDFEIPQTNQASLDNYSDDISQKQILDKVIADISDFLKNSIDIINRKKENKINEFLNNNSSAPQGTWKYYMNNVLRDMRFNMSDDDLGALIDKNRRQFDNNLRQETMKILNNKAKTLLDLENKIPELMDKVDAAKKDDLAQYFIHRKMILTYLDASMKLQDDDKYVKEEVIHNAIFPKKETSENIDDMAINLWLLDDRLAFHYYSQSDLSFKTSEDDNRDRADILIFNDVDNEAIARNVVIIELKRPGRNDKEDIVQQILNYIDDIKENKPIITKYCRRPIIVNDHTQYYCYGICDFTDKVEKVVKGRNFTALPDNLGYYSYIPDYTAHVEILSYNKILPDAKKRNRIFFEKLGIEKWGLNTFTNENQ